MNLNEYVNKILADRARVYHDYSQFVKDDECVAYVYERLEEAMNTIAEELSDLEEYDSGDQD